MVKDMFGYEHPPSSCCGAPILSSSGPGYEHLICDGCKRIIKDLTPKDEPRKQLSKKEKARLAAIVPPSDDLLQEELYLAKSANNQPKHLAKSATLQIETNIAPGVDLISPPIPIKNLEITYEGDKQ